MINLPIYRAKKIDSDEYVEGYYYKDNKSHIIFNGDSTTIFGLKVVDPTTLAMHFPDMLDSQGNKIFASLSEDGRGGDCTFMENGYNETFCWDRLNACIVLKSKNYECKLFRKYNTKETTFNEYTVIGIQE